MADIVIRAAYASVAEEEGIRYVGFAEDDAGEEGYALFQQATGGGPVRFEVNDDSFGADDAVAAIRQTAKGLEVTIRPDLIGRFGWAGSVAIRLTGCEDRDAALAVLHDMLPADLWAAPGKAE